MSRKIVKITLGRVCCIKSASKIKNNNPTTIENQTVIGLNRGPTWA